MKVVQWDQKAGLGYNHREVGGEPTKLPLANRGACSGRRKKFPGGSCLGGAMEGEQKNGGRSSAGEEGKGGGGSGEKDISARKI